MSNENEVVLDKEKQNELKKMKIERKEGEPTSADKLYLGYIA